MRSFDLLTGDGVRLDASLHPHGGGTAKGTIIQAHGITVDKDEGGMFVRLAEALTEAGFTVIRFSYRGHGKSSGSPRGVTIAGETLDLQAAIDHARKELPPPLSLVAASFGAVSASLLISSFQKGIDSLVLWNPVLDLTRTFLEPELPWGHANFNQNQQRALDEHGCLLIDGGFPIGRVIWREFGLYDPLSAFTESSPPALVVHGDQDSYVSYEIAREAALSRPRTDFHTIRGSDHGFDSAEREDEAIRVSVAWLSARSRESA
ncbi:alpha/beta hydrolase [Nocardiopsis sp. NPDC101807]|uniref:alpha/beta hydrolase n=1 Tax=Nocardiopsis sp. NPDC101807 TaxID=3364339 RepID=UPI003816A17B